MEFMDSIKNSTNLNEFLDLDESINNEMNDEV